MSQESVQPVPRPYSPWQPPTASDAFLPPAKRQRLDSAPPSPYAAQSPQTRLTPSVSFSNIALPNGYNPQRQINGAPTTPPVTVAPRHGLTAMGPPQRPAGRGQEVKTERPERELDITQLSDVTVAAGINLREEEDSLIESWKLNRTKAQVPSGTSAQSSFDLLSQNSFGAIGSQHANSAFRPVTGLTLEQEIYQKQKAAARAVNESQQFHLENPFLWGNGVRQRMQRVANDNGVRVPLEGLFDRVPEKPQSIAGTSMTGTDGSSIVAAYAPSVLNRNTALEPMLCLLSLAANERLRGLLEDAYGLARGRQYSSDGVVPPEWSDLAVADQAQPTTVVPQSITKSPWDAIDGDASAAAVKPKPSALPSPPSSNHDVTPARDLPAAPSLAVLKNTSITRALADLALRDRAAEEARQKLRAARAAKKRAQAAAAAAATPESGDGTTTPAVDGKKLPSGMLGERAPEIKMTKREMEKLKKQDASDEVATRITNSTASMQLAGMGKSYSWLTGGSKGSKTGKPLGKAAASLAANAANAGTVSVKGQPDGPKSKDQTFGEWREDGVGGKGIQLRDWVGVLETDGKERASLGWALMKLGEDGQVAATAPPGIPVATVPGAQVGNGNDGLTAPPQPAQQQ